MTCLLFLVVFILWVAVLLLHSGIPFTKMEYQSAIKEFHQNYFTQSLFFMQLLNGAILAFLIGAELNSFSLFDSMFVVNAKRSSIVLAKLISNLIILFTLITLESLIMLLIGIFIYPAYIPPGQVLLIIPFQMLFIFQFLLLGEAVASIFKSYFVPILIFVIQLTILVLTQQNKKEIAILIPVIEIVDEFPTIICNGVLYCSFCVILLMVNFLLFQRKDISN